MPPAVPRLHRRCCQVSLSLLSIETHLCRTWPLANIKSIAALFLVPAIQVIFGLETYFRAVRSRPFLKRGPWAIRLCLVGVIATSLASFIWAYVDTSPPFCFASLFWFVANYSLGCFVILLIVSAILTLSVVTIFMKLKSSPVVGPTERVDASRMVYYLTLAIISNVSF